MRRHRLRETTATPRPHRVRRRGRRGVGTVSPPPSPPSMRAVGKPGSGIGDRPDVRSCVRPGGVCVCVPRLADGGGVVDGSHRLLPAQLRSFRMEESAGALQRQTGRSRANVVGAAYSSTVPRVHQEILMPRLVSLLRRSRFGSGRTRATQGWSGKSRSMPTPKSISIHTCTIPETLRRGKDSEKPTRRAVTTPVSCRRYLSRTPARRGQVQNRVLSNCAMIWAASCTSPVTLLTKPSIRSLVPGRARAGIDRPERLDQVVEAQPGIVRLQEVATVEDRPVLLRAPADGDDVVENQSGQAERLRERGVQPEPGRVRQAMPSIERNTASSGATSA